MRGEQVRSLGRAFPGKERGDAIFPPHPSPPPPPPPLTLHMHDNLQYKPRKELELLCRQFDINTAGLKNHQLVTLLRIKLNIDEPRLYGPPGCVSPRLLDVNRGSMADTSPEAETHEQSVPEEGTAGLHEVRQSEKSVSAVATGAEHGYFEDSLDASPVSQEGKIETVEKTGNESVDADTTDEAPESALVLDSDNVPGPVVTDAGQDLVNMDASPATEEEEIEEPGNGSLVADSIDEVPESSALVLGSDNVPAPVRDSVEAEAAGQVSTVIADASDEIQADEVPAVSEEDIGEEQSDREPPVIDSSTRDSEAAGSEESSCINTSRVLPSVEDAASLPAEGVDKSDLPESEELPSENGGEDIALDTGASVDLDGSSDLPPESVADGSVQCEDVEDLSASLDSIPVEPVVEQASVSDESLSKDVDEGGVIDRHVQGQSASAESISVEPVAELQVIQATVSTEALPTDVVEESTQDTEGEGLSTDDAQSTPAETIAEQEQLEASASDESSRNDVDEGADRDIEQPSVSGPSILAEPIAELETLEASVAAAESLPGGVSIQDTDVKGLSSGAECTPEEPVAEQAHLLAHSSDESSPTEACDEDGDVKGLDAVAEQEITDAAYYANDALQENVILVGSNDGAGEYFAPTSDSVPADNLEVCESRDISPADAVAETTEEENGGGHSEDAAVTSSQNGSVGVLLAPTDELPVACDNGPMILESEPTDLNNVVADGEVKGDVEGISESLPEPVDEDPGLVADANPDSTIQEETNKEGFNESVHVEEGGDKLTDVPDAIVHPQEGPPKEEAAVCSGSLEDQGPEDSHSKSVVGTDEKSVGTEENTVSKEWQQVDIAAVDHLQATVENGDNSLSAGHSDLVVDSRNISQVSVCQEPEGASPAGDIVKNNVASSELPLVEDLTSGSARSMGEEGSVLEVVTAIKNEHTVEVSEGEALLPAEADSDLTVVPGTATENLKEDIQESGSRPSSRDISERGTQDNLKGTEDIQESSSPPSGGTETHDKVLDLQNLKIAPITSTSIDLPTEIIDVKESLDEFDSEPSNSFGDHDVKILESVHTLVAQAGLRAMPDIPSSLPEQSATVESSPAIPDKEDVEVPISTDLSKSFVQGSESTPGNLPKAGGWITSVIQWFAQLCSPSR